MDMVDGMMDGENEAINLASCLVTTYIYYVIFSVSLYVCSEDDEDVECLARWSILKLALRLGTIPSLGSP